MQGEGARSTKAGALSGLPARSFYITHEKIDEYGLSIAPP